MYNENKARLLKCLKWKDIFDEKLEKRMQLIPYKYRTILETRWGLVGENKICPNYKILGSRLDLKNPKQEYEKALKKLVLASYAECIADAKQLPFEDAVTLAGIAVFVWGDKNLVPKDLTGNWLLIAISNLPVSEQIFFSLIFWQGESMEDLANEGYSIETVNECLNKAKKTLKKQWNCVNLLKDSELFSFKEAVEIGRLATIIYRFNNLSPKCISGQKLSDTIDGLTADEKKVIEMFAKDKKATEMKKEMNLEMVEVQQILKNALEKVKSVLES